MTAKQKQGVGPMDRREFIQTSALLGTGALGASQFPWLIDAVGKPGSPRSRAAAEYALANPENIIYSGCRLCNVLCPIKVKVINGVVAKVDGSGYSPQNLMPHLPYETSPAAAAAVDGRLCPKGQASIQLIYDPYRIRKVLKRAGPRGSSRWVTISFDQAIDEIVNGGNLFAAVPGEEDRQVEGLKDIYVLRDPELAKKMAADVKGILAEKDRDKKQQLVERFKVDHADHLQALIDPDHPDLGPRNNQLVFEAGRQEPGREAFLNRFLKGAFGTANAYHAGGSICSASLYQARAEMSHEFVEGKWTGGKKDFAPDALHTEFILAFGINFFEARATTPIAARITDGLASGRLKLAVADPRLSKMAAKAWKWLPVKPGSDGALALGITRWIIEQERYDAVYLRNANKAAAKADHEPTSSNATWLVKIDAKGRPGSFLRASEIGVAQTEKRATKDGKEWEFDPYVVLMDGQPVAFDPNDEEHPAEGDLWVDRVVGEFRVKSSLQLLKEEAFSHSIEEWAEIAGVRASDVQEVAEEFTSHGKRASTAEYRGVTAHSNSFHSTMAIWGLNVLIGNVGWVGGASSGGGKWDDMGTKEGQPYDVSKLHPGKLSSFGIMLTRQGTKYEDSTVFADYPARRPWVPIPGGALRHEIYPSMLEAYPYPVKALFTYMSNTVLASPGGQMIIDTIKDPGKVPLFIASDVVIGETSMYADYIFPDISIWERWGLPGGIPEAPQKMLKVRQPTIAPIPETVSVFGEEMPISLEAVCLAIAERLGLPGFGPDGFGDGVHFRRPEEFYLKRVANVAFGEKADGSAAVPDSEDDEILLFERSRRHLPPSVFDLQKWQAAVKPELWRKVVYVLNRGGRFENFADGYKGEHQAHPPKGVMGIYAENVAKATNSMTGERFSGVARWVPARDLLGRELPDDGFDFALISQKDVHHGHTRTIAAYWALAAYPENVLSMNTLDANRLGLEEGDQVRLSSRTNQGSVQLGDGSTAEMVARVKPIEGIRPGVLALPHHFGHWAYGARDVIIDGETVTGDERRGRGMHPNFVVALDPTVPNAVITELVAGSAASYDARVTLVKV